MVISVYKSEDVTEISNYRPITLITQISKIFEKLIIKCFNSYLNKYILSESQFSFKEKTQHKVHN